MDLHMAGEDFDLPSIDASSTPGFTGDRKQAEDQLEEHRAELAELQEKLFAESRHGGSRSVLLVLQAMDTAGKGGVIRHVIGGVDPQGVRIYAFKPPTAEEKEHDFLWRVRRQLPPAGTIGVFDRSHYEDVLIHRVRGMATAEVIEERYGRIIDFEHEVVVSGTTIVKVMLQISAGEQKKRLRERLDRADKNWKYNPGDVDERAHWPAYQEAYQAAIARTSTAEAPWYVVAADHKWYAHIAVQQILLDALRGLQLDWPPANYDIAAEKKRLAASG